jgi:hypothetical protein
MILRIYGRGRAVRPTEPDWAELSAHFDLLPGTRQILDVEVKATQTSCGHGVPLMAFEGHRTRIPAWATEKGEEGMEAYRAAKNRVSLDGLPTAMP